MLAAAQPAELPGALSGRWSWAQRGGSQTFFLDDIKAQPDRSFTAKLTWWTIDTKCAIRGEPVVGRITKSGLAFDAKTKCDVGFTAELLRGTSGWTGQATTTGTTPVVVQRKAN